MPEVTEDAPVRTFSHLILRTDGAARGNPGPGGVGVVIEQPDGQIVARGKKALGVLTNNQAEYLALIHGLRAIVRYHPRRVEVRMDSDLVVKQMRGQYRVKHEDLQPLYQEAKRLAAALPDVTFTHVPREQNKLADSLANQALDADAKTRHAG